MRRVRLLCIVFLSITAVVGCDKIKAFFQNDATVAEKTTVVEASKEVTSMGIPVSTEIPTPEPNKNCSGKYLYGTCWHIAKPFESCEKFCASKGGCLEQPTLNLIKQNHCINVARAFFGDKTTQATCLGVDAVGCTVVKENNAVATSATPSDASCAAAPSLDYKTRCSWQARRVCACAK